MKVSELRQLLKASDRDCVEKAFVESYKQLRKAQKSEIDSILVDILKGKAVEKKTTDVIANFEELEQQILIFIENANAQNYFVPNRIIPKNMRPKWRFMVKKFIKELEKIPPESDNHLKSVKLLTDLYALICEACNYYLFSTDDPFRSIGWKQDEFFELVVRKTFAGGYSREDISRLILYATTGGLSRESLHIGQEMVLLNALKTSDVKYIAIEEAKKLVEDREEKLKGKGKYDNQKYYLEDAINELSGMILLLTIDLAEPERGVAYYFKHARYSWEEVKLYCALELIGLMDENELWIKVYESGIEKKIEPRDTLQDEYEERKGLLVD